MGSFVHNELFLWRAEPSALPHFKPYNARMWGVVASIAAVSTILALSETYLRSSDSALTKPGSKDPVKLLEKGRKLARKLKVKKSS
jgi:hypothetical protein